LSLSAEQPGPKLVTPGALRPYQTVAVHQPPQQAEPAAEISLQVTIGKLEVSRTLTAPAPPRPRTARPGLSLDAYLKNEQQATR
jgi:hypothetical protein